MASRETVKTRLFSLLGYAWKACFFLGFVCSSTAAAFLCSSCLLRVRGRRSRRQHHRQHGDKLVAVTEQIEHSNKERTFSRWQAVAAEMFQLPSAVAQPSLPPAAMKTGSGSAPSLSLSRCARAKGQLHYMLCCWVWRENDVYFFYLLKTNCNMTFGKRSPKALSFTNLVYALYAFQN
jgi:hypothetical protein